MSNERGPRILEISRTPEFAGDRHIAHVVSQVHGDVLLDRLITLEPGQLRSPPLECTEPIDELHFRLFRDDGAVLIHHEHSTFLRSVNVALASRSRELIIEDKLSARAKQKEDMLGEKASRVRAHTSHRVHVSMGSNGSWRPFSKRMAQIAATRMPRRSDDRWFPKRIEAEVGVIEHFNRLLHGGRVRGGVLVDPWFGAEALRRLAVRLESQDIHLTIVTSWTQIDPDTGLELDPARPPTDELARILKGVGPYINPRLTVINLVDGSKQAFHDRYLLLYPHDGPDKVFLLSNSVNKMAGNWPFCMSLLAPDVGRQAQLYIEGLCRGEDITRSTSPTINFKWP